MEATRSSSVSPWPRAVGTLLREDILAEQDFLDREVKCIPLGGRNEAVVVWIDATPRFVVKRWQPTDDVLKPTAEADLLTFVGGVGGLSDSVPHVLHADDSDGWLVLEFVEHSVDLRTFWTLESVVPNYHADLLGTNLALLHSVDVSSGAARDGRWNSHEPVIMQLLDPPASHYFDSSPALHAFLELLQGSGALQQALHSLSRSWERIRLCHNDIRCENILLTRAGENGSPQGLVLIDWELAGMGDPSWDIAGALAAYAGLWVESIPVTAHSAPSRFAQFADFSLGSIRAMSGRFMAAYRDTLHGPHDHRFFDSVMEAALEYVPARLVQAGAERCDRGNHVDAVTAMLLQVAANMVHRPDEARRMFGML